MATSMILQSLPVAITSLYLEINVLPKYLEHLFETTGAGVLSSFPKAYGGVIFVNVIFSGLYLVVLGMKVGGARKRFTDKVTLPSVPLSDLPLWQNQAIKDGEDNAEKRYSLPNLYADGHTENARLFNCVQRGHQQALETYPLFLAMSLIGGLRFPVFTTVNGLLWIFARAKWAEGYATGLPENRYSHWASRGVWHSLIFGLCSTAGTALGIMGVI